MQDITKLLDNPNVIILCSSNVKKDLVSKYSSKIHKAIFKSFNDFKKDLFPEIDLKMIIRNNFNDEDLEITKLKLENACLIQDDSPSLFIHELYELKIKNNLFINKQMLNYFNRYDIYIINYENDDDLLNICLIEIKNKYNLSSTNLKAKHPHTLYQFNDYEEEIIYITNTIYKLLKANIDINKIVINEVSQDYLIKLREIFSLYDISLENNENTSLYDISEVKNFINEILDEEGLFNEVITKKLENKGLSTNLINTINSLSVLNYFNYHTSDKKLKDIIKYILKHTYVKPKLMKNVVRIENIFDHIYDEDTYIFLLNFNQDVVPPTFKNNQYLSDEIRLDNNLVTSTFKNEVTKKHVIDTINSIRNLYISSSLKFFVRNSLLENSELSSNINIYNKKIALDEITSRNVAKLLFIKSLNKFNLYHEIDDTLLKGYAYFSEETKHNYDASFKKTSDLILNNLNQELYLSYSSLDDYFKCPFKYYLKHVLKITNENDSTNDNPSLFVGTLFHDVLEKYVRMQFIENIEIVDIETFIKEEINSFVTKKEINLSPKYKLYFTIFKENLQNIIKRIKNSDDNSLFKAFDVEKKFKLNLGDNIYLVGTVDKILKYNDYYIVVDYKTRNVDSNLNDIDKGLELQLPIYMLFIKSMDELAKFGGLYLQSILKSTPYRFDEKKTYDVLYLESTKYAGYTNMESDVINAIDTAYYTEEKMLPTIPFKNNGDLTANFMKHALSDTDFDKIANYVKKLIIETSIKIRNGEFPISPIKLSNEESACSTCNMKKICYMTPKNIRVFVKNANLDYILKEGGLNNEME